MAVLPNTSLVLSASQDGTLRTWDLQAAAQVGQVALSCWGQDVRSGHVNRLLAPASPGWPVLSLRASSVELWWLRELYSELAQLSAPVLHLQVAPELPLPLHPPLPARLVCACADGSVYLVSVATGRTVSALWLQRDDCAVAVAYCLLREQLWLLTRTGHLVCANAARCPMSVLHRVCPAPAPAPRPSCLHLYSHLIDPSSAFSSWETVRQHGGELCRSIRAWKDKNRWVPEPVRVGRAYRASANRLLSPAGTCLWWGTRMAHCQCSSAARQRVSSIQMRTTGAPSPPLRLPGTPSCPQVSTSHPTGPAWEPLSAPKAQPWLPPP